MVRAAHALLGACALLCATSCTTSLTEPPTMTANTLQSLPRLLDEALVPGMQVAVISGGVVETRAFGIADVQSGAPVTNETVFEAASLGKPVAAYGVLLLASAGPWHGTGATTRRCRATRRSPWTAAAAR
jgi:CubicO group peptidase (beta-lactamase class C family)